MLVYQKQWTAATVMLQGNPKGIDPFSYVNAL